MSEFSEESLYIQTNIMKHRQGFLKSSKGSLTELKLSIEDFLASFIIKSKNESLKVLTNDLQPSFSPSSPVIKKSIQRTFVNSSIGSTMPSVNYFKSPEGINLSLVSSQAENPVYIRKQSAKRVKTPIPAKATIQESSYITLVPYKGKKVKLNPVTTASCFVQVEKLQELKEFSEKQIAEEYHLKKTKEFDVYGGNRKSMPEGHLRKTSPNSKINTKYVMTETFTDKRVRTISQVNRPLFKAPDTQRFRRSSNISILSASILADYVSDPLRRVLEILPSFVDFGNVKVGGMQSCYVLLKNEDSLLVRFSIKQPQNKDFRVIYRPGPIAPGMIAKVIVEFNCKNPGFLQSEFEVFCKSEIYTVNISANVIVEETKTDEKKNKIKGLVDKIRKIKLPSLHKSIS